MNRNDIIRIAQEAGLHIATDVSWMPIIGLEYAEKFAALVIANHPPQSYMTWQEGYEAGKQTEREACAKLLEEAAQAAKDVDPQGFVWIAIKTSAEGIRERGQA
jgi:hypothetical protein